MNSTISSPTVVGTELSGDQLVIHGRCNTKGSGIFLADINGFRCTRLKNNYILRSEDGIGRRSQLSNCIIDSIQLSRGFIKKRFKICFFFVRGLDILGQFSDVVIQTGDIRIQLDLIILENFFFIGKTGNLLFKIRDLVFLLIDRLIAR